MFRRYVNVQPKKSEIIDLAFSFSVALALGYVAYEGIISEYSLFLLKR